MTQRGDIVYVETPFYDRPGSKERPAVVIQCDRNNRRLLSTLIAGITTNTSRAGQEPTQLLIDPRRRKAHLLAWLIFPRSSAKISTRCRRLAFAEGLDNFQTR